MKTIAVFLIATAIWVAVATNLIKYDASFERSVKAQKLSRVLTEDVIRQQQQLMTLYNQYLSLDDAEKDYKVDLISDMAGVMTVMNPSDVPAEVAAFMKTSQGVAPRVAP